MPLLCYVVFFFKQKTAYEMRISDWSSDACSSDLSQYIAGPFAGQQLADAGANVIKVERPDWGDPMRNFASDKAPLYGANFLAFNRNKRSIELNLQTPEGVETFRALAARADVVLENFRPDRKSTRLNSSH